MEQGIGSYIAIAAGIATIGQLIYAALTYHRGPTVDSQGKAVPRPRYGFMVLLVLFAWAAVGFDYWAWHRTRQAGFGEVQAPEGWGILPGNRAYVSIETGRLTSAAGDHYLVLAVRVADNQVDQVLDRAIEKSGMYFINGGRVNIELKLSDSFAARARSVGEIQYFVLLLPRTLSTEQILSLADVNVLGGQLLAAVAYQWAPNRPAQQ